MDSFKKKENEDLYVYYKNKVNVLSSLRLLVFVLGIICFFVTSSYSYYIYIGFIFLIFFVVLIIVHDIYYKKLDYYNKKLIIIAEYEKRINGKWKEFSDTGVDYSSEILSDLDIVGNNSLFQYLNICNTLDGRDKLIDKLSNNEIKINSLLDNQSAILELSNSVDFVLDFQTFMFEYRNKSIRLSDGFNRLEKKVGNKFIDLSIGIFLSLIVIILLLLGLFKIISINYFVGMLIFNYFINYMYSFINNEDFDNIEYLINNYSNLNNVYKLFKFNCFNSKLLKSISDKISYGYDSFNKLNFINDLNNFKSNILSSFIFNGLFSINMVVMYLYSCFQVNDSSLFKKSINSISDLEALISLSNIGIIRDDVVMPDIVSDVSLEFVDIKHPLIDVDRCVGNDFVGVNGVNIITGSNMGGKTSFLRTIGINLILMNAGTYVCSKSFKSCYFKIFTSMRVADDISSGVSTFYGELLRIKKALDYDKGARIILVDEIFKGTNYNDRIYGAVSVIKKLNDKRTILYITTHDFELCDIKDDNIYNYYVKEYYEGDNIKFDYKIRDGKCDSTNAKYLMKKIGIID